MLCVPCPCIHVMSPRSRVRDQPPGFRRPPTYPRPPPFPATIFPQKLKMRKN